jgi:hypothetical protein
MSVPEVKEVVENYLGNNQLVISDKDNVAIEFKEYIQK